MIYTRFGTPVKLTSCEVVREKSPRGGEFDQYYVTAEQTGCTLGSTWEKDGGHVGRPILDGQQFGAYELKADNGWGEILDACKALNPLVEAA